jgi:hypothetical protein
MRSHKAVRPTPACADREPRGGDHAGRQIASLATPQKIELQVIRAEIIGSNKCEAEGCIGCGAAPVLALCRKLIAAGFDPNRALHAYRGEILCIIVRTIGEAAELTVDEHNGTGFAKWKAFSRSAVSSRIAPFEPAATSPTPDGVAP